MFNKKLTTEQALGAALVRIAGDISAQQRRRNTALEAFSKAFDELADTNVCLAASLEKLDKLSAEAALLKTSALDTISHNDATMKRISEILEG